MSKICTKCKQPGIFCKDSKSKDGLQSQCKICKSKQIVSYLQKNKDKRSKSGPEKRLRYYYKHKISMNMSRIIRRSLQGLKKGNHWEQLVGYSVEELKQHLEKLFKEGMNWENYGKWHIDHVIPVSSFNIVSVNCEDFKKCWDIKNLQPLWAKDNLSKSNKIGPIC